MCVCVCARVCDALNICRYVDFDESVGGMLASFVARFPATDPELLALAAADAPFF